MKCQICNNTEKIKQLKGKVRGWNVAIELCEACKEIAQACLCKEARG